MSIYHERQDSQLCGQHCLNNLLQEPFYSSIELASIAQELDEQEMNFITDTNDMMRKYREGSGNVDESGNFSFQVLKVALERYNDISELLSWTSEEGRFVVQDPTTEKAFMINHKSHWYTIRKIHEKWWNLDSLKLKPEFISPFYLSAFLGQLREEGSTIFLVRGNIASYKSMPSNISSFPENCHWYTEKSLIESTEGGNISTTTEKKDPFTGTGNKLGSTDNVLYDDKSFEVTEDDDDDTILAKVLSASIAELQTNEKKSLSAAEIREKRLAALQK